jgi:hypothetical protein
MGARISNNSWGGGGYSQALYDAIYAAGQAGSLFVAAAGNSNSDNDAAPQYPASYDLENIVSVAASNESDALSYFSNYGPVSVDLAAPGSNILSLRPGGQFAYLSGTSMATPHVAGVAGLLLAQNPTLDTAQVKQLLTFGSDSIPALGNRIGSEGRLNAYRALKATVPRWLQPQITSGTLGAGKSIPVPLSVNTVWLVPGTYTQVIALSSNDPLQPTVDLPVELKVININGYNQWLLGEFSSNQMLSNLAENTVWSDSADPDNDGMSNLIEFITGSDPLRLQPESVPLMSRQGGETIFEFRVRETLEGATYAIEWSPSIRSPEWKTTGLTTVQNTTAGMPAGIRRMRVKLASDLPAAFFRISATSAP